MTIMIPFALYEFVNFRTANHSENDYFKSFWNYIDLLFITVYATYFVLSFVKPEYVYALKTL
jgi:hypothetical protein